MTVTTNERGQQNMFAKEPPMEVMEVYETHNEKAEKLNGRLAMLGVMAAIAAVLIGSGPVQLPFILGSAGVALAAHVVYQRRMPPSI